MRRSPTQHLERKVYTQEKIEFIYDMQIKRQRILKSLKKEFF